MNPLTLVELLLTPEFQVGLAWGIAGLVAILVTSPGRIRRPLWGVVLAASSLAASFTIVGRRLSLVLGLMTVVLGGLLTRRSEVGGLIVVTVGALIVALRSGIETVRWIEIGTLLFIIVFGWLAARIDAQVADPAIPVLMVAGTVFGVWATVPDTELARILMGAVTATFVVGWPLRRTRIGAGGAYAIAALLAWAVAVGGEARPGSIIGGWATVGAFTVAITGSRVSRIRPWALFALHAGSVFVASRIAGLQESPQVALAITGPALLATIVIGWVLGGRGETPSGTLKLPPSGDRGP